MKYCLVVTGGHEIDYSVSRMVQNFNLAETAHDHGFHLYTGKSPETPDLAVFNMEESGTADCAKKIRDLSHDHHLTLFCATDDHRIDIQKIIGHKLAVRPFDLGDICKHIVQAQPAQ